METTTKRILMRTLTVVLLLVHHHIWARDFSYTFKGQTLTYTVLDEEAKTAETKAGTLGNTSIGAGDISGDIEIPSEVSDGENTYTVTQIGECSFRLRKSLNSVIIPNSVTVIGDYAFRECSALSEITTHDGITDIGFGAFQNCAIKHFSIPHSLTKISGSLFTNCSQLTDVTIPSTVTSIGYYAFQRCSSLTEIEIPNSVTTIEESTFSECKSLKKVTIPNSVTTIKKEAFKECYALDSLYLPPSVEHLSDYPFKSCGFNPLVITARNLSIYNGKYNNGELSISSSSVVMAWPEVLDKIKGWVTKIPLGPYVIEEVSKTFKTYTFKIKPSPIFDEYFKDYNPQFHLDVTGLYTSISPGANGTYTISGLYEGLDYTLNIKWSSSNPDFPEGNSEYNISSQNFYASAYTRSTQTTVLFGGPDVTETETLKPKSIWYVFEGENGTEERKYENQSITFSGLKPNHTYNYTIKAIYNEGTFSKSYSIKTKDISVGIKAEAGPTSITFNGTYDVGDAKVARTFFRNNGEFEGESFTMTGLIPDNTIGMLFCVETEDGYSKSYHDYFSTTSLSLKTLSPKCVSETCAIVAAETNISDRETNVGFQWKKYDAPSSLAPSEGYAAIYNGMLEGYIKNLKSTSYYNVRAFYKTAGGKYYYSDWVTFDPSDFSYFEPTVHTYPAENISDNKAYVRGYALGGTDKIISQGIQYWPKDSSMKNMVRASDNSDGNIQTVEASGQVMNVELSGLNPDTEYAYHAFVKTDMGYWYGEEMTFRTTNVSGLDCIESDDTLEVSIIGYYDLSGNRHNTPCKGFNIVLYSNGTTKKLFVR